MIQKTIYLVLIGNVQGIFRRGYSFDLGSNHFSMFHWQIPVNVYQLIYPCCFKDRFVPSRSSKRCASRSSREFRIFYSWLRTLRLFFIGGTILWPGIVLSGQSKNTLLNVCLVTGYKENWVMIEGGRVSYSGRRRTTTIWSVSCQLIDSTNMKWASSHHYWKSNCLRHLNGALFTPCRLILLTSLLSLIRKGGERGGEAWGPSHASRLGLWVTPPYCSSSYMASLQPNHYLTILLLA